MIHSIKAVVLFILLTTGLLMAQYEVPDDSLQAKRFPWPDGKRAALSLTFDDARLSQIDKGIPLLDRYQIKATFYISPDKFEKRIEGWQKAAAAGHEIGNHTMTHPCTGNYAFSRNNALEEYNLKQITHEIDAANDFIFKMLGIEAVSFAYPCGQKFVGRGKSVKSYVPLVAKKFTSGRGWLGEDSNDPWFCDLSQVLAMESDGKSFEALLTLVNKAVEEGRWLILAGHEMADDGYQTTRLAALEKLCEYVRNPENGIWVAVVREVAEYIVEKR